eukprot:jgi/Undpi1/9681/HiC_scaffold_27.g12137.m1
MIYVTSCGADSGAAVELEYDGAEAGCTKFSGPTVAVVGSAPGATGCCTPGATGGSILSGGWSTTRRAIGATNGASRGLGSVSGAAGCSTTTGAVEEGAGTGGAARGSTGGAAGGATPAGAVGEGSCTLGVRFGSDGGAVGTSPTGAGSGEDACTGGGSVVDVASGLCRGDSAGVSVTGLMGAVVCSTGVPFGWSTPGVGSRDGTCAGVTDVEGGTIGSLTGKAVGTSDGREAAANARPGSEAREQPRGEEDSRRLTKLELNLLDYIRNPEIGRQNRLAATPTRSKDGVRRHGSFQKAAEKYGCHWETIKRIWRKHEEPVESGDPTAYIGNERKGNSGRNGLDVETLVPPAGHSAERNAQRRLAAALGIPTTTLHNNLKALGLRAHSNSIKPYLIPEGRKETLRWVLRWLAAVRAGPSRVLHDFDDFVHVLTRIPDATLLLHATGKGGTEEGKVVTVERSLGVRHAIGKEGTEEGKAEGTHESQRQARQIFFHSSTGPSRLRGATTAAPQKSSSAPSISRYLRKIRPSRGRRARRWGATLASTRGE